MWAAPHRIHATTSATPLSAADVRAFATGKLSHFKIPRYVHIVDSFPTTVTGQVRKVEMREIAAELFVQSC